MTQAQSIPVGELYDKKVNFLIGAGASDGLLPTLGLELVRGDGSRWSLEQLATELGEEDKRYVPLFMHYYLECILPAQRFTLAEATGPSAKKVIENYRAFLLTLLAMAQRRDDLDKRINLFTTNYDGCIPLVGDDLLQHGSHDFVLNDGTRGFRSKILEARNFNNYLCNSGVFGRRPSSVPQINLIHLHGSVYWKVRDESIEVDYNLAATNQLAAPTIEALTPFSEVLRAESKGLSDLPSPRLSKKTVASFRNWYFQLPIVNPTKWKFHQTVYEEHYYQMLRLMSYELEKPNAVLVTFGFSFADEHIRNLIKRSLSNPSLQVFVCCYNEAEFKRLGEHFTRYPNVQLIALGNELLDFTAFNSRVCRIPGNQPAQLPPEPSAAGQGTDPGAGAPQ